MIETTGVDQEVEIAAIEISVVNGKEIEVAYDVHAPEIEVATITVAVPEPRNENEVVAGAVPEERHLERIVIVILRETTVIEVEVRWK